MIDILKFFVLLIIVAVICSIDVIEYVFFKDNDWLFCLIVIFLLIMELLYFRWKDNR